MKLLLIVSIFAFTSFSALALDRSTTLQLPDNWALECVYDLENDKSYLVTKHNGDIEGKSEVKIKDIPSKNQRRRCFNAFIKAVSN